MKLRPEDQLILSCIKIHATPEELEQIDELISKIQDWEKLINTIIDRGIGPLFYIKLPLLANSSLIPEPFINKLQQAYYRTFSRSTYLYDHFRKVAQAFAQQGIPVIVLKGIFLSEWLYQDVGLRQFSDMDLLVKEEDGPICLEILAGMGYFSCDSSVTEFIGSKSEIVHYAPMVLKDVSVEIHIKLHRKSSNYQINVREFIKQAIPVTINTVSVYALNLPDLIIHLCVHLDKHFRGGHVQFTCFNDITNLLDIHGKEIDWNDFITACRFHKCESVVMEYLVLVNKYMHVQLPESIIQKYTPLLTEADEILFIRYLNGYIKPFSAVPTHLNNLRNLNLREQSRYVWDLLFPPKEFMIQKYDISDKRLVISDKRILALWLPWWFWYPYRWWIGVKGVIRIILPLTSEIRENP